MKPGAKYYEWEGGASRCGSSSARAISHPARSCSRGEPEAEGIAPTAGLAARLHEIMDSMQSDLLETVARVVRPPAFAEPPRSSSWPTSAAPVASCTRASAARPSCEAEIKEQTKATIGCCPTRSFARRSPHELHVVRRAERRRGGVGQGTLTRRRAGLFADAGLVREAGALRLGGVSLSEIAAAVGTPAYVYNAGAIRERYRALDGRSPVCLTASVAVKANSTLAILRILRDLGAGADIVSGGELARVSPPDSTRRTLSSAASGSPRTRSGRRSGRDSAI